MAAICVLDDVGMLTSWCKAAEPMLAAAAEAPEAVLEEAARQGISEGEWAGVHGLVRALRGRNGELHGYSVELWDVGSRRSHENRSRELVSLVSHELRTPLTAIRGALGLIAAGSLGTLPAKAHGAAVIAERNCERLIRIVNDILDLEKLESGKLRVECGPVEVDELVRTAVESTQPYGDKFGVRYRVAELTGGARSRGDSGRLLQVMGNLLSNAAKFSPAGQEVEVRARAADGGVVRIEVADHGSGIPEEFRGRMFARYAQASGERSCVGTGLGLSISKTLVEAMGGRIGYESREGAGTTFYVELREEMSSSQIP